MSSDTVPFLRRHIGITEHDQAEMFKVLNVRDMPTLTAEILPAGIATSTQGQKAIEQAIPGAASERDATSELRTLANENQHSLHSLIGLGCYETHTPAVLRRNLWENPGWYTAYTPYQAEISQGRLEMLSNFQQMIMDFTGLPLANASLLDESTAAAEAMVMSFRQHKSGTVFLVHDECLPQTKAVMATRARGFGIQLETVSGAEMSRRIKESQAGENAVFGALLQYPGANGQLHEEMADWIDALKAAGVYVALACDLLALSLLKSPGEMAADIAVGSTQRFGVPMGFGGPHAAFLAAREELKRVVPGRIIGLSIDSTGRDALRMALQTREQHIRRERATSNICTSQVLPANLATAWAIFHGAEGILSIAQSVHDLACWFRQRFDEILTAQTGSAEQRPLHVVKASTFDSVSIQFDSEDTAAKVTSKCMEGGVSIRTEGTLVTVSCGETTTPEHLTVVLRSIAQVCQSDGGQSNNLDSILATEMNHQDNIPTTLKRETGFLTHPVFTNYKSETELMRYLTRLQNRDLALDRTMIGLGSCTMKLNAASEMEPVGWDGFANMHPLQADSTTKGYQTTMGQLESWLAALTGFAKVSFQPNSGAQGEFAGLLAISRWHRLNREPDENKSERDICLIPSSAHGTNPASAAMAGLKIKEIPCNSDGSVSTTALKDILTECGQQVAAMMITYPSTHGVYEEEVKTQCDMVHASGGLVYLDGANFNAMLGLVRPAELGFDVCHLNLHKTFCIPHGGGGPGVGPICVTEQLKPYLPTDPAMGTEGAVSSYNWGSAGILPISWMYIRMMGPLGLRDSSQVAMLSANYIAQRLDKSYPVLYKGAKGRVAHECILDLRKIRQATGVTEEDIAKRLIDYGFHAPTISFPVAGTMMIEPTESESLRDIDRFCTAMETIRREIADIESGAMAYEESPLHLAPHTFADVITDEWSRKYPRSVAVDPLGTSVSGATDKYFPPVNRLEQAHGDRNLFCGCPPWREE